MIQHLPPS